MRVIGDVDEASENRGRVGASSIRVRCIGLVVFRRRRGMAKMSGSAKE